MMNFKCQIQFTSSTTSHQITIQELHAMWFVPIIILQLCFMPCEVLKAFDNSKAKQVTNTKCTFKYYVKAPTHGQSSHE